MNRLWALLLLAVVALALVFYFTRSRLDVEPHAAEEIEKAKHR